MMVVGQENVGKTTLLKLLSKKARKKYVVSVTLSY